MVNSQEAIDLVKGGKESVHGFVVAEGSSFLFGDVHTYSSFCSGHLLTNKANMCEPRLHDYKK